MGRGARRGQVEGMGAGGTEEGGVVSWRMHTDNDLQVLCRLRGPCRSVRALACSSLLSPIPGRPNKPPPKKTHTQQRETSNPAAHLLASSSASCHCSCHRMAMRISSPDTSCQGSRNKAAAAAAVDRAE